MVGVVWARQGVETGENVTFSGRDTVVELKAKNENKKMYVHVCVLARNDVLRPTGCQLKFVLIVL